MVGAAIKKKPGSLMPKQSNDSSVKPRAAGNKHVFAACPIDAVKEDVQILHGDNFGGELVVFKVLSKY